MISIHHLAENSFMEKNEHLSKKRVTGLLLTYICWNSNAESFMKMFSAILIALTSLIISSCDTVNEAIPDIETDFPGTFQIQIFSNAGKSDDKLIDIRSSEAYNDFKGNIERFELRKITYEINNFNAPEDMYFTGSLVCSNEENTESYEAGTMNMVNLFSLAEAGLEYDVNLLADNADKILAWLDSPGRFYIKSDYFITNSDNTPYVIDGNNAGSNFELVIRLYVTVKTKI